MSKTMDDITVKVTIEITQKLDSWQSKTIAKSTIEDSGSYSDDDLEERLSAVTEDARGRAHVQLANTKRIKRIEEENQRLQIVEKQS